MASDLAVITAGLTKRFGAQLAVDGVDLAIPSGVVCGFVGPNGAGKTTTIRMLLGLIRPTSGTGTVLGRPLTDPASYLDRVGALIESPAFYPNLSGRANLVALARLGRVDTARVDGIVDRVGLGGRAADLYRSYSLGMKQRLGIAASLLVEPTLLILDEPANGLDPAGIVEIRRLMRSLADQGITVFVSSHLLAEIEHVCDFFVMIQSGRLVFQGTTETLFAAHSSELLARPEHGHDSDKLIAAVRAAGHEARLVDGTVVVDADPAWAAELQPARDRGRRHADPPQRTPPEPGRRVLQAHRRSQRRHPQPDRTGVPAMILAAFASEWVKLRRRTLFAGTYGALAALAALFTALVFARASNGSHGERFVSLAELAQPNGLVHGLNRASILLGVVAFGVAAAQIAGEYGLGTLRQLLVRQPRRPVLLVGKYLAVLTFLGGAVLAASVSGGVCAVIMAHVRGISTSAWFSGTGLADMGRAIGDIALAVAGYATLGYVVGVIVRSSVVAVIVGFVYLLPFENIFAAVVNHSDRWLPGQLLTSVAQGGNSSARYSDALITVAVYLVIAAAAAVVVFGRTDVTA